MTFRFKQRLSTILHDRDLSASEQAGLDSYDFEIEDALTSASEATQVGVTSSVALLGEIDPTPQVCNTTLSADLFYGYGYNPLTWSILSTPPPNLGLAYTLDNSTSEIYATVAGVWQVSCTLHVAPADYSKFTSASVYFRTNTSLTEWAAQTSSLNFAGEVTVSGIVFLAVDDYLDCFWAVESNASVNVGVSWFTHLTRIA